MWPSLVKIQYTELKLSCGNDPVVKNSIYSNGDFWPNDPKINRVIPLPRGNHVAKFGKDPIYRTKVIVRTHAHHTNHIIRLSRDGRMYKNDIPSIWNVYYLHFVQFILTFIITMPPLSWHKMDLKTSCRKTIYLILSNIICWYS